MDASVFCLVTSWLMNEGTVSIDSGVRQLACLTCVVLSWFRVDIAETLIIVVTSILETRHSMRLPRSEHVTVYRYRPQEFEITHFRTR